MSDEWVKERVRIVDDRAQKRKSSVGVLVTAHHGQLIFLESCLKSVRGLGWTILLYDNPAQQFTKNLPKEKHYNLIDQFFMKHITKEMPGPTYPQFWHYRAGVDLLRDTDNEYIFTIGADCVLERPEGIEELKSILGDGDILACSSKNDRHKELFCGTKSFLVKKKAFLMIVDYLQTLFDPFKDIGNMENRFGRTIRDLGIKEVIAPKMPNDDQFSYSYDAEGNCVDRGTWGEVLGFRHLAGEYKIRGIKNLKQVEEKYFDKEYLGKIVL